MTIKPLAPLALVALLGGQAWAGPPFLTDDPEPAEAGHWELYAAAQWSFAHDSAAGTAPHLEINYGALPFLMLHLIFPAAASWQSGQTRQYGPGDLELGAKLRFVEEGEWRPQIGIFPLVDLPTGSSKRGLGAGRVQALLPLWLQKSFGPWTTYGGGGLRLTSDSSAVVLGWLVQRAIGEVVALGTEAYLTVPTSGDAVSLQFNVGLILNFTDHHHLLLSAGPSFGGGSFLQTYLAYQLTL
jgi:hypothetical protein